MCARGGSKLREGDGKGQNIQLVSERLNENLYKKDIWMISEDYTEVFRPA